MFELFHEFIPVFTRQLLIIQFLNFFGAVSVTVPVPVARQATVTVIQ